MFIARRLGPLLGVGGWRMVSSASVETLLRNALEMAGSVEESAVQLMLETDPSDRQPRSAYLVRYQEMAAEQLKSALDAAEGLEGAAQQRRLALLIADTKLEYDNINACMRKARNLTAANEIECPD